MLLLLLMLKNPWPMVVIMLAFIPTCALAKSRTQFTSNINTSCTEADNEQKQQHEDSELHCVMSCSKNHTCRSVQWDRATELCHTSAVWNARLNATHTNIVYRRILDASKSCPTNPVSVQGRSFCPIQQRRFGRVDFARSWTDYENGFGDLYEFWIGLRTISELTQPHGTILRIEMMDSHKKNYFVEYTAFKVQCSSANYKMQIGHYDQRNSNIGDSISSSNNSEFSTMDRDNDNATSFSCSADLFGNAGWWFNNCSNANPNGQFNTLVSHNDSSYVYWQDYYGFKKSLTFIRIMLHILPHFGG